MSRGLARLGRRFVILTMALVAAGCTGSQAANTTRYTGDGITFDHPSDWMVSRTTTDPLLEGTAWELEVEPPDGVGYLFLAAFETPGTLSDDQLRALAENYFRFEESEAMGILVDEPLRSTSVAGANAIEAHLSQELEAGDVREKRAFVFAHGDAAYVMTCYYEQDDTGACDLLMQTLSFEDAA